MKSKITIAILLLIILGLSAKIYLLMDQYDILLSSLIDTSSDENVTYINDKRIGQGQILNQEGRLSLSLTSVQEYIDDEITVSNSGQRIYVNLDQIAYSVENERSKSYIESNLRAVNIPLIYVDGIAYIDLETICELYAYNFKYFESTNSLVLYNAENNLYSCVVSPGTQFYKSLPNGFAKYRKVDLEETVIAFGRSEGYDMALDSEGHFVYVKDLVLDSELSYSKAEPYTPVAVSSNEKVSLAWEAIETYQDNVKKLIKPFETGTNVISPTWFNLNVNGIVINSASREYSHTAHESGLKVWGLFKNNFDPAWTHALLESEEDQKYAIAQMLFYSSFYELDGVNFDFENIYLEDKDAFAGFIEEASREFQNAGLQVSIDITRPGGSDQWSKVYDRTRLGRAVDYVCLMAYDEFWGSSPISGPVASLPWTKESIEMSLNEIPPSKLVLGIPLYMRIWEETQNSKGMYVKTGSSAVTMGGFDKIASEKTLKIQWDEDAEQYYGEYEENATIYRVWIEDETSIGARLNLAEFFELPGIAAWRRGYGSDLTNELFENWIAE